MNTSDILNEARKSIQDILKNMKFKKAIKNREKEVEIQLALQKCRGALEKNKEAFDQIIRTQCRQIHEGEIQGQYTDVQEQLLYDAALGYILVKDAIYAIQSMANIESMNYAYNLLDFAIENMTRKKPNPIKAKLTAFKVERSAFSNQVTEQAYAKREELAFAILPELKKTGHIENALKNVRLPEKSEQNIEIDRINSGIPASMSFSTSAPPPSFGGPSTAAQSAAAFLDAQQGTGDIPDISRAMLSSQTNPKPPTGGSGT